MKKLIHTFEFDLIRRISDLSYCESLNEISIFFELTKEFSKVEDFKRRAIINNTPILMRLLHLSKDKEEESAAKKWHGTYIKLIESLGKDYDELVYLLEFKFQNENSNNIGNCTIISEEK